MQQQILPPSPAEQQGKLFPANSGRLRRFALALVALAALGWLGYAVAGPGPLSEAQDIVIPFGTGTIEIGHRLADAGIIRNPWIFAVAAKLTQGGPVGLKAGEYHFTAGESLADALAAMRSGLAVVHKAIVTEGMSSAAVVAELQSDKDLTGEITDFPAEGTLLPDTYLYDRGEDRQALIRKMQDAMKKVVDEYWAEHKPNLPLKTPQDMVTMASIVEKESAVPEERPAIAGVFYNRLRANMRLQADATVVYALTHGEHPLDRTLTHEDCQTPSPFNTYFIDGLPPAPIGNPGREAIAAAAMPEEHDYLYFVANGHGGHKFAHTLEEHDANIERWKAYNREHAGDKAGGGLPPAPDPNERNTPADSSAAASSPSGPLAPAWVPASAGASQSHP